MNPLLVGASVRAASASLGRIGYRSVAFDLFGDLDLAETAGVHSFGPGEYPSRVWDRVSQIPPSPWLYTGAMENHPDVVEAVSRRFRLLGNGPDVLRSVKNPLRLAEVLRTAGCLGPEVRSKPDGLPTDGSWLAKPVASGGGEGIWPWRGAMADDFPPRFYQEKVVGPSFAAIFVREASETRLRGITRQYLGRSGNRFAYRGSLGPWPMPESTRLEVSRLGRAVGDSFGLVGIFGIDLIVVDGLPWLIEVNPRYTASVEVLERATGRSIMAEHLRAFGEFPEMVADRVSVDPTPDFVGKVVLFARKSACLNVAIPVEADGDQGPGIADIPRPGTVFEAGHPVMTVFGRGRSIDSCRIDLARQLRRWRTWLDGVGLSPITPGC